MGKIISVLFATMLFSSCNYYSHCFKNRDLKAKGKYCVFRNKKYTISKIEPFAITNDGCNGMFLFIYYVDNGSIYLPVLKLNDKYFIYNESNPGLSKDSLNSYCSDYSNLLSKDTIEFIKNRYDKGAMFSASRAK